MDDKQRILNFYECLKKNDYKNNSDCHYTLLFYCKLIQDVKPEITVPYKISKQCRHFLHHYKKEVSK